MTKNIVMALVLFISVIHLDAAEGVGYSEVGTLSSLTSATVSIYNSLGSGTLLSQNPLGNISPLPIKICSDGAEATEIVISAIAGYSPDNLLIRVKEDPNSNNALEYGDLEKKSSTANALTYSYIHPRKVGISSLYREAIFEVINTTTNSLIHEQNVQIYRTPVLMIHGLWGGKKDDFKLMDNALTKNYLPNELTLIHKYRESNAKDFYTNRYQVNNGVQTLKENALEGGYSLGKVNVIGHSMGGILSRLYIQSGDFNSDIARFITLNTPHSGSQMANYLYSNLIISGFMSTLGNNCFKGAVKDLQVDSEAIREYLNGDNNINKNRVPSRAIITTAEPTDLFGWLGALVEYTSVITPNFPFYAFFGFTDYDYIVADNSQQGGLTTTDIISNQGHMGSYNNTEVIELVKGYFDEDPDDGNYFSTAGFNPPIINYNLPLLVKSTGLESLYSGSGEVNISSPPNETEVLAGESVNISASGTGDIKSLFFAASSPVVEVDYNYQETAAYTFQYQVPTDASGKIKIGVFGIGEDGLVARDSIFLNIKIDAAVDSISTPLETISFYKGTEVSIPVYGYFNDGIVRDLYLDPSLVMQSENTSVAEFNESGALFGVTADTTYINISYLGAQERVKVIVVQSDFSTSVDPEVSNEISVPKKLELYQNYPNPFNPTTVFSYEIPKDMHVKIVVYNMLGQEIAMLENSIKPAGRHNLTIDGSKLSSGVYFYALITDKNIISKKMLLIK